MWKQISNLSVKIQFKSQVTSSKMENSIEKIYNSSSVLGYFIVLPVLATLRKKFWTSEINKLIKIEMFYMKYQYHLNSVVSS